MNCGFQNEMQLSEIISFMWGFEMAGHEDGDIACGRVSYTAPLRQKIIGGALGNALEIFVDNESRNVVIIPIQPAQKNKV